jgi:hypothetical protein
MLLKKGLEIDIPFYEPTKETLIKNGSKVSEQFYGSRKILYGNNQICGYAKMDHYLTFSEDLDPNKFYAFLGAFKRSLYNQIKKNNDLLGLKIEFNKDSKCKNLKNWAKVKSKSKFYNIDISSAYWQMAHQLGYISKTLFEKYIDKDEYKEAKRYCISFLARENFMNYHDQREIQTVHCDISALYQIYENIRNQLYLTIHQAKDCTKNWLEYNIDAITIIEEDLDLVCQKFNSLNIQYKVNECIKLDKNEYFMKGKIRKF